MASPDRIERLLRLNEEIATLARARVPIASELPTTARLLAGGESPLTSRVKASLNAGATLDEALEREKADVSAFYVAIVKAGLASNRLPAALEAFGVAYQRLASLREAMTLAMIYPVAVVFLAWVLLSLAVSQFLPTYNWIGIDDKLALSWLRGSLGPMLMLIVPTVLAVAFFAFARWRTRKSPLESGVGLFGWLPGVRSAVKLNAYAAYSWTLALLVRNSVPLSEALELATDATGWSRLREPSHLLADRLRQGRVLKEEMLLLRRLPPLVRVSLLIAETPPRLAHALEAAAYDYDRRARASAERVAAYFPAVAVMVIGGTTAAGYAYVMLQPYIASLVEMSRWYH